LTSLSDAQLSLLLFSLLLYSGWDASKEAEVICYLDLVTDDSCDFIPVVCKSFGVWSTPLVLQLLISKLAWR